MNIQTIQSESVRLPHVGPGEVVVVTRYSSKCAVVVHPDDYEDMLRAKELVARLGRLEPRSLTAVEASVIRSAQDEDFDLDLIRDEDLLH